MARVFCRVDDHKRCLGIVEMSNDKHLKYTLNGVKNNIMRVFKDGSGTLMVKVIDDLWRKYKAQKAAVKEKNDQLLNQKKRQKNTGASLQKNLMYAASIREIITELHEHLMEDPKIGEKLQYRQIARSHSKRVMADLETLSKTHTEDSE